VYVYTYKPIWGGVATISRLLQLYVSFAEYRLVYRALLQKRPMILRSLLIVATPYKRYREKQSERERERARVIEKCVRGHTGERTEGGGGSWAQIPPCCQQQRDHLQNNNTPLRLKPIPLPSNNLFGWGQKKFRCQQQRDHPQNMSRHF